MPEMKHLMALLDSWKDEESPVIRAVMSEIRVDMQCSDPIGFVTVDVDTWTDAIEKIEKALDADVEEADAKT